MTIVMMPSEFVSLARNLGDLAGKVAAKGEAWDSCRRLAPPALRRAFSEGGEREKSEQN